MGTHLGNILEQVIRMERIGISELSRKLKVSRRTIYNWFEQENLNIQIILEVGEVIGHDFTSSLPESIIKSNGHLFQSSEENSENNMEVDNNSVFFWMNKYVRLLEKYNELLSLMSENSITHPNHTYIGKNDNH